MSERDGRSIQKPGPRLFTAFVALAVAAACVSALVYLLTPHAAVPRASTVNPAAHDIVAPSSPPARDA
jgi:hypothetical protein